MQVGDQIGDWLIDTPLGEGGNATVWRASRGEECVALKVLNTRNPQSERYARFRREIQALRAIGGMPGVLPLLDFDLPDRPSRDQPAWLAMPVAQPIDVVLSGATLETIVEAIASFATTLAELHERHQLHHRDIKPSNLYVWNDLPCIGDLGLVDLPDATHLTAAGRPLGPFNFMAYEMLSTPDTADPAPADVYALSKTLWVLATDQRWAPLGEQSAANQAHSIREYRAHRQSHHLDQLIERGTRHVPDERPTMDQFARDLRAWLTLSEMDSEVPDTAEHWQRFRKLAQPRIDAAATRKRLEQAAGKAARRLAHLLEPLHAEIRREFPEADFDAHEPGTETMIRFHGGMGTPQVVAEDARSTIISGPGYLPMSLVLSRSVVVTDDQLIRVRAAYYLGKLGLMGSVGTWRSDEVALECDSLEVEALIASLTGNIVEKFPEWLSLLNTELASDS